MKIDTISTLVATPQLETLNRGDIKAFNDDKTQHKAANNSLESSGDQVKLNTSIPRQTADTMQKLGNITALSNNTAKSLRETVSGLSLSAEMLDKMKAKLETITKNFPPFPIDSSDRKKLLMSYRSLQKEIEKLTIPAPPPPAYDKVAGMWGDLFGQSQTGSVSTADLPDNASDAAVAKAAEQIAGTSEAFTKLNSAIGAAL